ncbi:FtsH/Yme1/Tma family ATP-dependent metallopeptidase [Acetivibrio straminisolvens]|jgi:cell division protease FtsH|uniref:Cell division protein FtsH n=1 Tax=Acetivibrio straminisolvens JCM 21531 TaxID=1294263 RepID=W4V4A2_9FIRM|nr:FtsH/Yme1/Tma family ATP-dependent metallopeptidase [Acetivibrio straminisolvens]GAE87574.1 cell division protein FtsH [Acetivibrio straminisolvens JCM 21531]
MKNKKNLLIVSMVILTVIIGITLYFEIDKSQYIPYSDFYSYVKNGKVVSAKIGNDEVSFYLNGDETEYRTDNPELDSFKEFLLLNGVKVSSEKGMDEFLVAVTDAIFNIIFFGIIIFGLYKLLDFRKNTFKVIRDNNTKFSDVAGMEELKREMLQAVDILKHPKEYAKKGIRPINGILLEGNPGNGKTLFARALAGEAKVNFIATKATDFQSAIMSIGPAKIKALFRKARANKPCIIFIDEFDGIGEKRNYSGTGIDKENNRIIAAMLNEMDGFTREEGVMVIAATNNYKALDEALVRAGRFDKKYTVPNPDYKTRIELIKIYTRSKKLSESISVEQLAAKFENLSCSQIETILNEAAMVATGEVREDITEIDLVEAVKRVCNVVSAKEAKRR